MQKTYLRHCIPSERDKKRKFPLPKHFDLRSGEDGLSFSDESNCSIMQHMIWTGLSHNHKGAYIDAVSFRLFRYSEDILHDVGGHIKSTPVKHDSIPAPIGKPNNPAHCDVVISPEDQTAARFKLSNYSQENESTPDKEEMTDLIMRFREKGNDTPFHRVDKWGVIWFRGLGQ